MLAQEALQKVCGGYLACVEQFESMVPASFVNAHLPEIEKTFLWFTIIIFFVFQTMFNNKDNQRAKGMQRVLSVVCPHSTQCKGFCFDMVTLTCWACLRQQFRHQICLRFQSFPMRWGNSTPRHKPFFKTLYNYIYIYRFKIPSMIFHDVRNPRCSKS